MTTITTPQYTLHLGDCRDFMRGMEAGSVVTVTDPPYGIGYAPKYTGKMGGAYSVPSKNYAPIIGDDEPFDPTPFIALGQCALFGAEHFANRLPDSGSWIVWDKRCGVIPQRTQGDCEFIWLSISGVARIFRHMWDGMLKDSERGISREHPTQKPELLMAHVIEKISAPGDTIFDPFMGSGTTGVAALQLGRRFIGCELDAGYFAIAQRRIEQAAAQPLLIAPEREKATQLGMDA